MSKYAFSVKNSAALLAKAKHDAERFNRPNNNAIAWSYAAIDFIQTAWHIGDWISKESGQPLSQVRQDIDELCNGSFFLVGDLANGQKHWQRDGKNPPQIVAKTSAPAPRMRPSLLGMATNYRESPFVIDSTGKKIYAQILIQDTLRALEKYMSDRGIA
ncbi:MAG: hypothetical protein IIB74_09135 [Proteobacteria bacterium]|nr:hypothetical protein [Pseudomonadota bacterium]